MKLGGDSNSLECVLETRVCTYPGHPSLRPSLAGACPALGPSLHMAVDLQICLRKGCSHLGQVEPGLSRESQMVDGQIPEEKAGCCGLISLGKVWGGKRK